MKSWLAANDHPAGSSKNLAICEDVSKFCLNVGQWEGSFFPLSVEYPQISKTSELYLLFGQHSSDAHLVGFNFIGILKNNCDNNQRYLSIFRTMWFFFRSVNSD